MAISSELEISLLGPLESLTQPPEKYMRWQISLKPVCFVGCVGDSFYLGIDEWNRIKSHSETDI